MLSYGDLSVTAVVCYSPVNKTSAPGSDIIAQAQEVLSGKTTTSGSGVSTYSWHSVEAKDL